MKYRIPLFRRFTLRGWRWYFHIKRARNGEIVAASQGYSRHIDCRATAEELKAGLGDSIISDPLERGMP